MKLAIFGAGKIVQEFLEMVKDIPEINLTALLSSERSIEKNKDLIVTYDIDGVYTNEDEILKRTDVDTVYVALPNHLHFEFSKKALEAGKHVICEKPFTLTLKELEELEAIALEKDLVLIEAITNQYFANFAQLKEDLNDVGDLKIIECNYSQYSSRYDAFKEGTILPAFNPKMGGGSLMDINIYNIHLVVGLLGKPNRVEYYANIEREIDTSGILVMEYDQTKVVCIGSKDTSAPIKSTIQGTDGSLIINGPTNTLESYTKIIGKHTEEVIDLKVHPHRMYEEFIAFNRIIKEHDMDTVREKLTHSKIVMEVAEKALEDASIKLG
ncbi:Gfo/Idh/MocA family oxidoreductase [Aerococcaceae bacterium INB8]|uniref:Gfo/Idh/MocA family oxidoreductase n=1 Tax=Ruoffia halotolerans TaxID=2748684 RepID=A0A839A7D2_9LACT|nr:Gfo/Idh/MocA family oxidoreductase [Ruoffia halotolerans]MBA5729465.1 Gfo/Idh/MocA family oxidoreductase [Ruoffia halotolerans]